MDLPETIKSRVVFRKPHTDEKILPPAIDQIKNIHPCPDCGKVIDSRVVQHRVYFSPYPHWRHQCMACKNYKNPTTNLFDLKSDKVVAFFSKYFRRHNK